MRCLELMNPRPISDQYEIILYTTPYIALVFQIADSETRIHPVSRAGTNPYTYL